VIAGTRRAAAPRRGRPLYAVAASPDVPLAHRLTRSRTARLVVTDVVAIPGKLRRFWLIGRNHPPLPNVTWSARRLSYGQCRPGHVLSVHASRSISSAMEQIVSSADVIRAAPTFPFQVNIRSWSCRFNHCTPSLRNACVTAGPMNL
jgi:hypothetical protein